MHKFDIKNISKLDNEWRREVLPPLNVLEALGLRQNDTFADFGCGIGYFTIPAAELVSKTNKVYALDISEEMLIEVERRAQISDVKNVIAIQNGEYDFKLPDATITFGLLANVIHEIENKERVLWEISRILKPSGRLAIVEWEKAVTENGPSIEQRIGREELKQLLDATSFEIVDEKDFNGVFYGLTAVKKEAK